jgi:hypothetical protein
MSEDRILKALSALKEADDGLEASPGVEARLMYAFRKQRSRRFRSRVSTAVAMLALAAMAVTVGVRPRHVVSHAPEQASGVLRPDVQPQAEVTPATPVPRKVKHRKPVPIREIATQFYPLLDVQPPFERGELVRVMVPAGTMRTVGFPVSEDHLSDLVQADVLVGQEGLARAIRFVGFEK